MPYGVSPYSSRYEMEARIRAQQELEMEQRMLRQQEMLELVLLVFSTELPFLARGSQ